MYYANFKDIDLKNADYKTICNNISLFVSH